MSLSSAPGKPGLLEETDMNKCDASNCPLEGTTTKLPNGGSMTLCPEHRAKLEVGSPVLIGSSDALLAVQPSLASTFLAAGIEAWMASGWRVAKADFDKQSVTFERAQKRASAEEKTIPEKRKDDDTNAYSYEALARRVMSGHFKTNLFPRKGGMPKLFDLVSADNAIVGDAKYFSMVNGTSIPPAKFSIISEHVWLLEKSGARTKFLVFGNDRRVPQEWLKRYGKLNQFVKFFFLGNDGKLEVLEQNGII